MFYNIIDIVVLTCHSILRIPLLFLQFNILPVKCETYPLQNPRDNRFTLNFLETLYPKHKIRCTFVSQQSIKLSIASTHPSQSHRSHPSVLLYVMDQGSQSIPDYFRHYYYRIPSFSFTCFEDKLST